MNDEDFMREALKEAELALSEGNWPIRCVIVLDGEIVARSRNQVYSRKDKTCHAEMIALKEIQDLLSDNQKRATLYTTYEPCPMCFGATILSRIKRVVSGIDIDKSGAMFFRDNLPLLFKQDKFHVEFDCGVLADECHAVFIKGEPTKKLIKDSLIRSN